MQNPAAVGYIHFLMEIFKTDVISYFYDRFNVLCIKICKLSQ